MMYSTNVCIGFLCIFFYNSWLSSQLLNCFQVECKFAADVFDNYKSITVSMVSELITCQTTGTEIRHFFFDTFDISVFLCRMSLVKGKSF